MTDKCDISSKEDIAHLVDSFYAKATIDPKMGFFFTDVAKLNFEKHMPIMYDFWESILLGGRNYRGNPMVKHFALHEKSPMKGEHFERWLSLWKETVDEIFTGPKADEAKSRAQQIAQLMQFKVTGEV